MLRAEGLDTGQGYFTCPATTCLWPVPDG